MPLLICYWLLLVFVIGVVLGSFLNVAISRLPLEKSLLWPSSRCGNCYQPIRWYDNLPLLSYLWLKGRCRTCGAPFSIRYFLVELTTGLGFVGLFYLEVVLNIHDWPGGSPWSIRNGFFPWQWWAGFAHHALLFLFLLGATACDLSGREIPFSLTLAGSVVGLAGAVLMPWPWPGSPVDATPRTNPLGTEWMDGKIGAGVYAWPYWGPLPEWLAPGGNWQTGLATGLAGLLVGTLLVRAARFLSSAGLGREALGLGDADLMMMAGCFLGWQPVAAAFFVSAAPGLVFGIIQVIVNKDDSLPFGPALAAGLIITMLCWHWIGPFAQVLFFWGTLLAGMVLVGGGFMLAFSYGFRVFKITAPKQ
jgi:leader peptidase (prepilin peptidase)/N-methyltransferase